jgi:ubiquinone/menaquinone biosynthesis C-methylase UbiE
MRIERLLFWMFLTGLLPVRFTPAQDTQAAAAAQAGQPDAAGQQNEIPPPLTEYMGRKIAPTMHYSHAAWLIRPERQQQEDCEQLLDILGVETGQVVCDLGCGNGFYTAPLARLVGEEGKVLAVDIQPEMLVLLRARLQKEEITNVEPILGTVIDPKLAESSVDMVLLVDVYHEFSHPEHMLRAIRKCLKPEGVVVLVEFRAEDESVPIKPEHKMSKEQIMKEFPPNGFTLVEEYDELPWQHVMYFERTPDAAPDAGEPALSGAAEQGASRRDSPPDE